MSQQPGSSQHALPSADAPQLAAAGAADDGDAMEGQLHSGSAEDATAGGNAEAGSSSQAAGPGTSAATSAAQPPPGPPTLDELLALAESCGSNHRQVQLSLRPAILRAVKAGKNDGTDPFLQPLATEQDPLLLLDSSVHSLIMLFLLTSRVKSVNSSEALSVVIPLLEVFAAQADVAQLHLAPDRVTQLGHAIAHVGNLAKDASWALNVLSTLFNRYVADSQLLTGLHQIVLYQCLKAGAYDVAFRTALQFPVVDVEQPTFPVRYSDVLQYFYYAGLINAKQGLLAQAIDSLEQCITVPTQALSAIQVDAYKKLIILQLIQSGTVPPLPEYTSSTVVKGVTALCRPYLTFAKVFEDRTATDVDVFQKVEEIKDIIQRDQNSGLLQQCLATYRSRRIQRLATTYSCISVAEIARLVGMSDNAEGVAVIHEDINNMILAGWIDAVVEYKSPASEPVGSPAVPIVRFRSAAEGHRDTFTSAPSLAAIQAQLLEAQRWKLAVEERERAIARSAVFLHKQMHNKTDSSFNFTPAAQGFEQEAPADLDDFEDDAFASEPIA